MVLPQQPSDRANQVSALEHTQFYFFCNLDLKLHFARKEKEQNLRELKGHANCLCCIPQLANFFFFLQKSKEFEIDSSIVAYYI